MAVISRITTWSDGQTLTASALNGEFNNILSDYNGNITNANIAPGAAISASKLSGIITASSSDNLTNKNLSDSSNIFPSTLSGKAVIGKTNLSGTQSTTSLSYADLFSVAITTTVSCNILVLIAAPLCTGSSGIGLGKVLRDTTPLVTDAYLNILISGTTYGQAITVQHMDTAVPAGTYTYKFQWKVTAGSAQMVDPEIVVIALPV